MNQHPLLILVRGLPGSGKSYFADALREHIGNSKCTSLDPDATDYTSDAYKAHVQAQIADGVEPALHPYRFLRAQAYQAITEHKIIIWNQPFTNLEMLKKVTDRLIEYAHEKSTTLPILIVEVAVSPAVAKDRVSQRKLAGGHGPSDATFTRFTNEYSTAAALGYEIISIDGQQDPQESIPEVIAAINRIKN